MGEGLSKNMSNWGKYFIDYDTNIIQFGWKNTFGEIDLIKKVLKHIIYDFYASLNMVTKTVDNFKNDPRYDFKKTMIYFFTQYASCPQNDDMMRFGNWNATANPMK